MKKTHILLISLLSILAVSCTSTITQEAPKIDTSQLQSGMTKNQVRAIMGEPDDITVTGNVDIWLYRSAAPQTASKATKVIGGIPVVGLFVPTVNAEKKSENLRFLNGKLESY